MKAMQLHALSELGCSSRCASVRPAPATRRPLGMPALPNSRRAARIMAQAEQGTDVTQSVDEGAVMEYCSLDATGKRPMSKKSVGELEMEFLDALRAFYDGTPNMTNEEFDILKEELIWQGSKVAVLSGDEQRFLEASLAYYAGAPFLSDTEYDDLKKKLKKAGSEITVQGPRCSLRSRKLYSDTKPDYIRMTLLNAPAALLILGAIFSIDDITGFEFTKLLELPEPLGVIVVWGFVLPVILVLALSITNIVFKDALILKGPCPECGTENLSYFGDILTVAGNKGTNEVVCGNCKSRLVFNEDTREITIAEEAKA